MERPTGVTVLAVLAFIVAGLAVLGALILLVGGAALSSMMQSSMGGTMMAGVGAIAGIIVLFVAALYAVTGYGLWKLQNWGRILCLVLVVLGLLSTAVNLIRMMTAFHIVYAVWGVFWIAIDIWIITYLLKPHVKQAFGAS